MIQPARLSPCSPAPKSGPRGSDDEDLASLQRPVRGGWRDTRSSRGAGWDVFLPDELVLLLLVFKVAAAPLWLPVVLLSRRRQRADLRRQLAKIPPERLSGVLRVVREEPPSSGRSMVVSILRQMGIPTEVSPAPPPGGRGDEASAV